jgi:hypothetical protein
MPVEELIVAPAMDVASEPITKLLPPGGVDPSGN